MARENYRNFVIEKAEDGLVDWEDVARECLAQMSTDDCYDVADALGLFDEDGQETIED
jgi:hypothetical protein